MNTLRLEEAVMSVLRAIEATYARWQAGELSQEDALFEIGDHLERLPPPNPDLDEGDV
jgi:hypothetical protein